MKHRGTNLHQLAGVTATKKSFLFTIFVVLILTDLSIFLDVPILRQVLGFVSFTFLPGLFVLYALKLNRLELTEKFVLSLGLSISFLMLFGLAINWLYPFFGYNTPLSSNSLIISFSVILLGLGIFARLRNKEALFAELSPLIPHFQEKIFLIAPTFFPLLSIFGMHIMNTTDNNILLMLLLFLIPSYLIFICIKHEQVSERIYPIIILLTGISLVLLLALRSKHLIGADIHTEYYIFQQTFKKWRWQIFMNNPLDACLSISILPTIYQSFVSINSEYLFKLLYPIFFSISPLIVFIMSKKYLNNIYALLSSFFFMSQHYFLGAAFSPRTVLAILFFALSVMVLFHDEIEGFNKRLLFTIFAFSTIISHYSTSYIFFFILLLTKVGTEVMRRVLHQERGHVVFRNLNLVDSSENSAGIRRATKYGKEMTTASLISFFVMLFLWYSQIIETPFNAGIGFITTVFKNLHQFFILEARGRIVVAAFGVGLEAKPIPAKIEFVISWLTIFFVIIGVVVTLLRSRYIFASPSASEKKCRLEFPFQKLKVEFYIFSIACFTILVASVTLPFVFVGYALNRTYTQMMIVLSPFFIIGGKTISRFLHIKRSYLVILLVLILYFMCTTGTMYQLFRVPGTITLNSYGQANDVMFVHDQETYAAKWLKRNAQENMPIYADFYGDVRLISQGKIRSPIYPKEFIEQKKSLEGGYIFLRYCGVVDGKLMDANYQWHDITEYQNEFIERNLIYSNKGSQVWK